MFPFFEIIPVVLNAFLQAFIYPPFLILFVIVCGIIIRQYRQMDKMREQFFGFKPGLARADFLSSAGYGLLGGLFGSFLAVFIGLTISGELYYLWPVAILLMMINMRFICFAYAGGILALSNLLLGVPQINVPALLALVAALHMVESFLIFFSGHLGAVPAYIKGSAGKITGGFTMQRFWPIPIVVLAVITGAMAEPGISMPDWWPLVNPGVADDPQNIAFALLPLVAGLGYGDIALARSPVEKSRISALFLGLYSLILLALAVLAGHYRAAALVAAVFSPLGHEAVIYIGRWLEFRRKPLYVSPAQGMMALEVVPDSPVWRAGLRRGDIITAVNGVAFAGREEFNQLMLGSQSPPRLDYFSQAAGLSKSTVVEHPEHGKTWGLLPVPEGSEGRYVELITEGLLARWLKKAKDKFNL
jgi:hypothetical protein